MTAEDRAKPWLAGEAEGHDDARRHAPATMRNREAIAAVLADILPGFGLALEIASGSGEHAAFFAERFPALTWQPTDPDPAALASIAAWRQAERPGNLLPPLMLDAVARDWPVYRAEAILCINMVHISPWEATLGLMRGAGRLLRRGAPLYLYGPYLREGTETAPSNLVFHATLKARDPAWGLRSVSDVCAAAAKQGLKLSRIMDMPANNLSLIFRRT